MKEIYWGYMMHLGFNYVYDEDAFLTPGINSVYGRASRKLRCDRNTWNAMVKRSVENGVNMVVIDLSEGLKYESHPELGAEGAWSVAELHTELARLRSLGITPIPKLNFSLTHNKWLGPYRRLPTSDIYNKVCVDLINEVCDIFDTPPMFHLGMDEENLENQRNMQYAMVRQFDLWWHDLFILLDACYKKGVRPALWSDHANNHLDEYTEKMPKDVVQFHWYYWNFWNNAPGEYLNLDDPKFDYSGEMRRYLLDFLQCYEALDKAGYDIIPTGSFWNCNENFQNLTEYARNIISPDHLLGFMQTPWLPSTDECRARHLKGIDLIGQARKLYRGTMTR